MEKVSRFYYTFGSSDQYPYNQEEYVMVEAYSQEEANQIFRKRYPDYNAGVLNCAFCYTEEQFLSAKETYYSGKEPAAVLNRDTVSLDEHINRYMDSSEHFYPKEDAFVLLSVVYMVEADQQPVPGDFYKGFKEPARVSDIERFGKYSDSKTKMASLPSKIVRISDSVGNAFYMVEEIYMVETIAKRNTLTGETEVGVSVVDYPKEFVYQAQGAETSITQEEVNQMIERHGHFLRGDCESWEEMRADFSGMDLRGIDFGCRDLSGAIFTGANLRGTNFMYTSAAGAIFRGADFSMAQCYGIDLQKADLDYVRMEYANFEGAHLTDAHISFAHAKNVNLEHANMDRTKGQQSDFSEARMKAVHGDGAELTDCQFDMATMYHAQFDGGKFSGSSFVDADLRSVRMFDADLWCCKFRHADLSFANISGADLRAADMTEAKLYGTSSAGAIIGGSYVDADSMKNTEKKAANSL